MRKLFFSLMGLAAIFATTSCSNDDFGAGGPEANVTFTTEVEGLNAGRTIADGNKVDELVFAVYDEAGAELTKLRQIVSVSNGKANVSTRLVSNKAYKVAFFAYNKTAACYDVTDLNNVTITKSYVGNDDTRDAFFACEEITPNANASVTVKLTRPFAQLNFVAKDADAAQKAGAILPAQATLTVKGVYSAFNVLAGDVVEGTEIIDGISISAGAAIEEGITVGGATYDKLAYVSMNYLLVKKAQSLSDATITISDKGGKEITKLNVPNLPVQANYRTNIVGSLFTNSRDYEVIVDPQFAGVNDVTMWDGKTTADPAVEGDVYEISTAAQFAGFAKSVNAGVSYRNKTVKLMNDINLNNEIWTPISGFVGTFDGQTHTIYNLNVPKANASAEAGLFAGVNGTIQNLKVEGAIINGVQNTGVIAATMYGYIKNCEVNYATVTSSVRIVNGSYDDGNNVGGIVGYMSAEQNAGVTGCKVANTTITAYRDLGGIVGTTNKDDLAQVGPTVSDNEIGDGVKLIQNLTNGYKVQAPATIGAIIGRDLYSAKDNNTGNVTVEFIENGNSATALKDAITNAEAIGVKDIVINLGSSANVEWKTGAAYGSTPFVAASSAVKTITINGGTLTATGAGIGEVGAANGAVVTFNNMKIVDNSATCSESSWEFGYLEFSGNLKFNNCDFVNAISLVKIDNAIFNNCKFNSHIDSKYAVWVHTATSSFTNCYFTGARGIKIMEAYGSNVKAVSVDGCTFENLTKKPGLAIDMKNGQAGGEYYSSTGDSDGRADITIKNSTFTNCQKGDQNGFGVDYVYESDNIFETITCTGNTVN